MPTKRISRSAKPPKCFISYSWDSASHRKWVREFAARLVSKGVDVVLDAWDVHLASDLMHFMETSVRRSKYVLLVCTPKYAARANSRRRGVGIETMVISGEIFLAASSRKFVSILRAGAPAKSLPSYLKSKMYLDFRGDGENDENFEALLRHLFNAPKELRPKLGDAPEFSQPIAESSSARRPESRKSELAKVNEQIAEYQTMAEKTQLALRVASGLRGPPSRSHFAAMDGLSYASARLDELFAERKRLETRHGANKKKKK